MTEGEKSFKDKLEFQIALRKIDSAFEACSKFEGVDQKTLFEAIGNLLFQHAPPVLVEAPTSSEEAPCGSPNLRLLKPLTRIVP